MASPRWLKGLNLIGETGIRKNALIVQGTGINALNRSYRVEESRLAQLNQLSKMRDLTPAEVLQKQRLVADTRYKLENINNMDSGV